MKLTYLIRIFFTVVSCILLSCTPKSLDRQTILTNASDLTGTKMRAVNCWYVEDNGSGQHGYAAVDVIFNYVPPDGYGLYETISEVRKAMKLEEFHIDTVVPHFEGELPVGWKIRDLTTSEINALLGREGEGGGDD